MVRGTNHLLQSHHHGKEPPVHQEGRCTERGVRVRPLIRSEIL